MFYKIVYVFCITFILVHSQSPLKQLHILFRHGERAPLRTYPNDPHKDHHWSRGWDHLSNNGILQMYRLGEILRAQYKHFIPKYYWYKDVNVSSSYADRCKMSAEALSAGLFPPEDIQVWNDDLMWQPVPVSYSPRSEDTIIAMKAACPKYDKMFDEVMQSKKVQDIIRSNQDLLAYLTEHTGENVSTIGTVETLYNTIQIEQLNNLTLPVWLNETILKTMRQLGAQNLALYSETDFMKRMKGGSYLKYVFSSMEKSLTGGDEPMLHLYGGHDITLVHVLRSLNVVDTIKPEFGAYLTFEMYSDGTVKIIYRNSWDGLPESLNWTLLPASLPELVRSLEPVLPTNWSDECKLSTS